MGYQAVIDVSEHQGDIDFKKMAATGVVGAIPRAGINGRRDKRFDAYVAGIRSAGLALPAVYWFANPKSSTSGAAQGALLAAAVNQVGAGRGMIDAEWYTSEGGPNPVLKGVALARWYSDMADAILSGTGAEPIIYTNATFWDPLVAATAIGDDLQVLNASLARLSRCELILARYPIYVPNASTPGAPSTWADWAFGKDRHGPKIPNGCRGPWAGWQFSAGFNGQGPTYGVSSGDLDLNIVTDEAWARWTGAARPAVAGTPAPDDDGGESSAFLKTDPVAGEKLTLGSKGNNVRTVQVRLAVHGYATAADGDWGPVTDGKVRTFQTLHGLAVDGVVNVPGQTWEALNTKPAHPTVRPGYEGGFVAVLQRALNALAGTTLEVDGRYGVLPTSPTRAAIEGWQQANSLEVDGVAGQQTWAAIDQAAATKGYTVA
jgi:peptidoglycan hydrolase-like protein with peptidoglycan-binding domain/GH25 family lysozyme M1 (1,4-beta-N-acetylmuramidase)